jgi:hypothetical protein
LLSAALTGLRLLLTGLLLTWVLAGLLIALLAALVLVLSHKCSSRCGVVARRQSVPWCYVPKKEISFTTPFFFDLCGIER